jgi:hypothetical protein
MRNQVTKMMMRGSIGSTTLCGSILIQVLSREPQKKETQVRLDHSPAPTQLALLSPICFDV